MQKVEDNYTGMSYQEMFQVWSGKHAASGYKPHELERIHRTWKSLGKKIQRGAAVRIR